MDIGERGVAVHRGRLEKRRGLGRPGRSAEAQRGLPGTRQSPRPRPHAGARARNLTAAARLSHAKLRAKAHRGGAEDAEVFLVMVAPPRRSAPRQPANPKTSALSAPP